MSLQGTGAEEHGAEKAFFLGILRDLCAGRKTPRPDTLPDVAALARIAEAHDLGSIVYSQCRRWAETLPGCGALRRDFLNDAAMSVNRADIFRDIVTAFSGPGIPVTVMKGAVLREYYPEPALRSMGDMDLVVRREDREESDRIMTEALGFRKFVAEPAVWSYCIDRIMVEIHGRMFYEDLSASADYPSYFDRVWEHCRRARVYGTECGSLYVPEDEFHFIYLMAHTAKHVTVGGSGFRAYLDMAMTARSAGEGMDWDEIGAELEKLELFQFTKTCFSLCERWFGVSMPYEKEPLDEEFYRKATAKTFADGVFGFGNRENETAGAAKEIGLSAEPYNVAAVKRGIRKFFPSYENMRITPWYSFVDGRPYLLPAAWAYRLGYCSVNKFRESMHFLAQPFTEKAEVKARQEFLRQWGLRFIDRKADREQSGMKDCGAEE